MEKGDLTLVNFQQIPQCPKEQKGDTMENEKLKTQGRHQVETTSSFSKKNPSAPKEAGGASNYGNKKKKARRTSLYLHPLKKGNKSSKETPVSHDRGDLKKWQGLAAKYGKAAVYKSQNGNFFQRNPCALRQRGFNQKPNLSPLSKSRKREFFSKTNPVISRQEGLKNQGSMEATFKHV